MMHLPVRKTVLLAAILVLALVYVLQLSLGRPAGIREFVLETAPDTIEITGGQAGTVRLVLDGDRWVLNDERYPADAAAVQSMVSAITTVRAPGRVSGNPERGDFGFDSPLTITAFASGKKLRTLHAGKVSANALQTYCRIDGSDDVYLVSGNLRNSFDRTVESLREKTVYALDSAGIERAVFNTPDGGTDWVLERSGNPPVWNFAGSTDIPDAEKTAAWIRSVASLRVQEYASVDTVLPDAPQGTLSLTAGGKTVTVTVHEKDEETGMYLCTSSELPYTFRVSSYTGDRLVRNRESFLK